MILAVDALKKNFGGLSVLRDVTFSVEEHEIVGLIGPNGAGKSTLFNLIAGLLRPSGGTVSFREQRIDGLQAHKICALGLAKTSQLVKVFGSMTILENALVGALLRSKTVAEARRAAQSALERVGLLADAVRTAGDLSLVDRMRLELARALCTGPDVLLIDELMPGLNPPEIEQTLTLLRQLRADGMTLIVIEHNMGALMRLSDRILALDAGTLVAQGSPEQVSRDPRVITSYLGEKFAHALHP